MAARSSRRSAALKNLVDTGTNKRRFGVQPSSSNIEGNGKVPEEASPAIAEPAQAASDLVTAPNPAAEQVRKEELDAPRAEEALKVETAPALEEASVAADKHKAELAPPVQEQSPITESQQAVPSPEQAIAPLVIDVKPLDSVPSAAEMEQARPDTWIRQTDLEPSSDGGVFGLFTTNLPMVEYPVDADYNSLLPFDMTKGFNDQFERRILMLTPTQSQFFKDLCPVITREFKRNATPEQRKVRSNAQSPLLRLMVDFFIKNAPALAFEGVTGEQSFRANLGLQPLPELEIYDHEARKAKVKYGALKKRLNTTDYKPEVVGVFDGWKTQFVSPAYKPNATYAKLAQLNFPQGFVSGMHRVQVAFTPTQYSQLKRMENYLNQQIESNRDPSQASVDRKSPSSALYRTMFDFFYSHARPSEISGVSDEQSLRSRQGIQPLPELTLFLHEKNKQG